MAKKSLGGAWSENRTIVPPPPVVLTVEVPKAWCIWANDLTRMKETLRQRWEARDPHFILDDDGEPFARFEDLLDDVAADREVRINRPVPTDMITSTEALPPVVSNRV